MKYTLLITIGVIGLFLWAIYVDVNSIKHKEIDPKELSRLQTVTMRYITECRTIGAETKRKQVTKVFYKDTEDGDIDISYECIPATTHNVMNGD